MGTILVCPPVFRLHGSRSWATRPLPLECFGENVASRLNRCRRAAAPAAPAVPQYSRVFSRRRGARRCEAVRGGLPELQRDARPSAAISVLIDCTARNEIALPCRGVLHVCAAPLDRGEQHGARMHDGSPVPIISLLRLAVFLGANVSFCTHFVRRAWRKAPRWPGRRRGRTGPWGPHAHAREC